MFNQFINCVGKSDLVLLGKHSIGGSCINVENIKRKRKDPEWGTKRFSERKSKAALVLVG